MKHQTEKKKINTNLMPISERPDEKFMKFGVEVLTDAELLAAIIRTGSKEDNSIELSKKVLTAVNQNASILNLINMSLNDLQKISGIGKVKAIQMKCIAELSKRISQSYAEKKLDFNSPQSIANYYMGEMRFLKQEVIKLLFLDTRNNLICDRDISKGTVNVSIISPREIFIEALSYNAVFIVLIHNHPSGDPRPSKEDLIVTDRVKKSGDLIGIRLLDHIIIGDKKYISLKEQGTL